MEHAARSIAESLEIVLAKQEQEWVRRITPVEYVVCKTCGHEVDGVSVREACLRTDLARRENMR
jgi:hypothetical protein